MRYFIGLLLVMLMCNSPAAFSKLEFEVNKLIRDGKYDEALERLGDEDYETSNYKNQMKGYLYASGKLKSGKDICKAVGYLENAFFEREYLRKDLDLIYAGDWSAIASKEGNALALFDVGHRLFIDLNKILDSSMREVYAKRAYRYFYNAAQLKLVLGNIYIQYMEEEYSKTDFSQSKRMFEFRKVLCSPRTGRVEQGWSTSPEGWPWRFNEALRLGHPNKNGGRIYD